MVLLKYKLNLLDLTKVNEEEIQAKYVRDVLKHIKKTHGKEAFKEARSSLIAVNGVSISLQNHLKTELKSGDHISFFPMCGGG